LSDEDEPL
jgi:hypothetical protein